MAAPETLVADQIYVWVLTKRMAWLVGLDKCKAGLMSTTGVFEKSLKNFYIISSASRAKWFLFLYPASLTHITSIAVDSPTLLPTNTRQL